MLGSQPACFLCDPDPALIYAASSNFVALLGLGPIVEGYSLIATKAHTMSMFDLADDLVAELTEFQVQVKRLLGDIWNDPVITEHGRVGLCEDVGTLHEEHCYHAHQLVFPTNVDFSDCLAQSTFELIEADSFAVARSLGSHLTEYLYYQRPDNTVLIGHAQSEPERQFFRHALADKLGRPAWSSWATYPRHEVIESARRYLSTD